MTTQDSSGSPLTAREVLEGLPEVRLDAIRERDRAAVPRMGDPASDPLLRAEMDRRELLRRLDELLAAVSAPLAVASTPDERWRAFEVFARTLGHDPNHVMSLDVREGRITVDLTYVSDLGPTR